MAKKRRRKRKGENINGTFWGKEYKSGDHFRITVNIFILSLHKVFKSNLYRTNSRPFHCPSCPVCHVTRADSVFTSLSLTYRNVILGFQWAAISTQHLLQKFLQSFCVAWEPAGTRFIIACLITAAPTAKSPGRWRWWWWSWWRCSREVRAPCFSSLEVSGWLKRCEVEVNQPLPLRVILSFMVCFNQ